MPTFAASHMPIPKGWGEFEDIVCSAVQSRWRNSHFTKHGRPGQKQHGVDIYGKDDEGVLVGVQCKNTLNGVTPKAVEEEIEKAEGFEPALGRLFIATTSSADAEVQAAVRKISESRVQHGAFEVHILYWDDIWADLSRDEDALFKHYPQLRPNPRSHDQDLFEEFQRALAYEPTVRLFREHDFHGDFPRGAVTPLYEFVNTWDNPEKEFLDAELQAKLTCLYRAAYDMSMHLVGKTVPIGERGDFLSVYSDQQRAEGPRPQYVREEGDILNAEARRFVPVYVRFVRLCRSKLYR